MVSRCPSPYRLPRVCECGVHGRAVWLATLLGVDVSNTPTISAEFITSYFGEMTQNGTGVEDTTTGGRPGVDEDTTGGSPGVDADTAGARLDVRLIDAYDGTTDVVEWYTQATLLCEYRGVSVADVLPMRLKGGAFAVWSQLPPEDRRKIDEVKNALFAAFAMDDCAAHTAFTTRTLQAGESVDVYLASLRRYATLFGGVTDRQLTAAFVNGLPPAVGDAVRAGAKADRLNLTGTVARARAVLGNERSPAVAAARGDSGHCIPVQAAAAVAATPGGGCVCRCGGGGSGGSGGGGRQQPRVGRYSRPARRCWGCGNGGHLVAACPEATGNAAGDVQARAQSPGH